MAATKRSTIRGGQGFTGFDPDAVALLATLPQYDEARYGRVRDQLADGLRGPGFALIEAVAGALGAPLTVDRRRSVAPLHRDRRFAAAGTPRYKDHLLLTAWEGPTKQEAPTLWIRLDAESVGFASGVAFTPAIRTRWREAVGGADGARLAAAIAGLDERHRRHGLEVAGDQTKRVPKPWPADHPRTDLLRRTGFQIRFHEPLPRGVGSAAFAAWCTKRLGDLMPVHRWLVDAVSPSAASGELSAADLFWGLAAELRGADPRIVEGTIMNGRCLRVGREFLALVDYKGSGLVVKLPKRRVDELIDAGVGRPFAPAGRVFAEWLSVPQPDPARWRALLGEGVAFVGG